MASKQDNIEIERKFLVKTSDFKNNAERCIHVVQGYLLKSPDCTIRVRLWDNQGFITVKSKSSDDGLSRHEWENEIPLEKAKSLLELCDGGRIDKIRYIVPFKDHTFEVDVFAGDHEGLILAEVELQSTDEVVEYPDWIGEEVTGDIRYYNSYLCDHAWRMPQA